MDAFRSGSFLKLTQHEGHRYHCEQVVVLRTSRDETEITANKEHVEISMNATEVTAKESDVLVN